MIYNLCLCLTSPASNGNHIILIIHSLLPSAWSNTKLSFLIQSPIFNLSQVSIMIWDTAIPLSISAFADLFSSLPYWYVLSPPWVSKKLGLFFFLVSEPLGPVEEPYHLDPQPRQNNAFSHVLLLPLAEWLLGISYTVVQSFEPLLVHLALLWNNHIIWSGNLMTCDPRSYRFMELGHIPLGGVDKPHTSWASSSLECLTPLPNSLGGPCESPVCIFFPGPF